MLTARHREMQPPRLYAIKMSTEVGSAVDLPTGAVAETICVHYRCSSQVVRQMDTLFV